MIWKKVVLTCFLLIIVCCFLVYNSNHYQAIFNNNKFYAEIYSAPFDVTQKGATIRIPLKFSYKTRYGIFIKIPDYDPLSYVERTRGFLEYHFLSDGVVLKSGKTFPSSQWERLWRDDCSFIGILGFDLPLPGASKDLVLKLTVVEPFNFFIPFSGDTYCVVKPNASFK
ncbi:hypothetical protein [Maridesulfovibrio frigidus]|uniref:hypothetical protein n=1 Tax=Maridesulfovibrio frigidus TaxID=340956 RepID=UPI00068ECDFD|nr:hypothetical protein [Maridesulfovibrio frigidus]